MLLECAPSCQTCHQIDFTHRCPFDDRAPLIWGPGDLDRMFERIISDPYIIEHHAPNVLARPPLPWVVTLENITTEEESQRMIELGAVRGYERSQDVGKRKYDGTFEGMKSDSRTSSNTWCVDDCWEDPLNQQVIRRVENITAIPDGHSEYWQLLKYEKGQYYRQHHDYISHHLKRTQGPRILTVFLYLNDVTEGGGTRFVDLGITVQPKRGRAVLWPSVKSKNPLKKDYRTHHEALPVIEGVKYGANAWIHTRDFKKAYKEGCT